MMIMAYLATPIVLDPTVLYALFVWGLLWKGLALWYSARNKQKKWFLALLIINSVGILSILYLFLFSKTPLLNEMEKWGKRMSRKKGSRRKRKR
jgi:methionyl-tRNA synthetase